MVLCSGSNACMPARIPLLDDKSTTKDNGRFFDVVMFVTVHERLLATARCAYEYIK